MNDALLFVDGAYKLLLDGNEYLALVGRHDNKEHIYCTIIDVDYLAQRAMCHVGDGETYEVIVVSSLILLLNIEFLGIENLKVGKGTRGIFVVDINKFDERS